MKRISRYDLPGGAETQTEPGSHGRVLRNRMSLTRKQDVDRAEYEALIRAQEAALREVTAETRFTAERLRQMHREWLGEIYEWAGEYRTVDLSKGGFTWPPAVRVPDNMAVFESGLLARHTPCRPASLPETARGIAAIHAELLFIHPFREGNGRLARWLADLMAAQAGLPPPNYGFTGRGSRAQRARYLAAVQAGYLERYDDLTAFFVDALVRGGVGG